MEPGRDDAKTQVFLDTQIPWGVSRYGLLIDEVVELVLKALAATALVWFSWHDLVKRIQTARDTMPVPDLAKSEETT